jgi:hypothetical protein
MDDLKITAQQWEKLNVVNPNTDVAVSSQDKKRLLELFLAVEKNKQIDGGSSRGVAEETLVDAVRELDQKHYEPMIARANQIADEVKAIFTDAQFTGLMRRYGTW